MSPLRRHSPGPEGPGLRESDGRERDGCPEPGGFGPRVLRAWPPLVLLASFSTAYVLLAPSVFQQDWDSLMYAYRAEVDGVRFMMGNHPLAHVLLYQVHLASTALGYAGRALPVYVIANGIAGGLAVTLAYVLLKEGLALRASRAVAGAILLGAGAGAWRFVATADVYSLAMLLAVLSWAAVIWHVSARERCPAALAGAAAGLALLAHHLNGVFLVVAPLLLLARRDRRLSRVLAFYGGAAVVGFCGVLLLGILATGTASAGEIARWARGYLGDPLYGTHLTLASVPVAIDTASRTILPPTFGRGRWVARFLFAGLLGVVAIGLPRVRRLRPVVRAALAAAAAQCVLSWLLITWFQPSYPKFWLLALVPLVIAFACLSDAVEFDGRRGGTAWRSLGRYATMAPLALAVGVLLFNARYSWPERHRGDDLARESVSRWLAHSTPDDVLITAGDLTPQLWFWFDRPNALHLFHQLEPGRRSSDRFGLLRARIDGALCRGHDVLLAPAVGDLFHAPFLAYLELDRSALRDFLDGYARDEVFRYRIVGNGVETPVYRLRREGCEQRTPRGISLAISARRGGSPGP